MTRKPTRGKHSHRTPPIVSPGADNDSLLALLKLLVAALIAARWLTPTESAADGDTLWIVQLWLGTGLVWFWRCYRAGDYRLRVDRLDLLLWVVIAGHVCSAIYVFVDGGQKRAALNMLWEWVGLGAMFFLARQVFRTSNDRQRMMRNVVVLIACLAALGVWQHFVFYPRTARDYQSVRDAIAVLQASGPAKTAEDAMRQQQQIQELNARLAEQGVPLDETSRLLWESRLRASSEPFGLFALANSFAGLLAAGCILSFGLAISPWKWGRVGVRQAVIWGVAALVLYCLVLTKSRTAWCGLAVGGVAWAAMSFHQSAQNFIRKFRMAILGATVAIVAAFALAGLSGGFDWEVISEAPKSLSYRTQYWRGSWNMLLDRPVFGAGPGNFRQHYLKHKLPESSEAIADPHNLLLDLWSSGGLLALAGFAGFIICAFRPVQQQHVEEPQSNPRRLLRDPFVIGTAAGSMLVWSVAWLFGDMNPADYRFTGLPLLLVGQLVLVGFLGEADVGRRVLTACLAAAGLALLVHLLGSGGMEMPAITQTLLLLTVLARGNRADFNTGRGEDPTTGRGWGVIVIAAATLVAFFACLSSATAPVIQSRALVARGEDAQRRGKLQPAEALYRAAAERDPLSPRSVERLAGTWFDRWALDRMATEENFQKAVELQQLAIRLDPYNWLGYQTLGQWYQARYERVGDRRYAQLSTEYFEQAVNRYPASSALQAELAHAFNLAGAKDKARDHAALALELDGVNHRAGHRDKYLPENILQRLERLKRGE